MLTQHPTQWAQYMAIKTNNEHNQFFTNVPVAFKNSIKAHFLSSSLGAESQIVFDIDRNIVDTIVGDMLFNLADEYDNDEDADVEDPVFDNEAELHAIMRLRLKAATTMKSRALALFKRIQSKVDDNDNDETQFSYSVTIPKMKTTLFSLVVRYISCGASFRMFLSIISCTYEVLGDPCLRAYSCQDVSKFIWVVCAINLQHITDVLWRSYFSIVLDFATHQSTMYFNLRFCVFIEEDSTIVNLHGCALPMFDSHTGEVMFDMVNKFLTMLYPDWTIHLIGLASDGPRNMTGRIVGVVSRLDATMHDDCPLTQI
jgi:hypothetical protein